MGDEDCERLAELEPGHRRAFRAFDRPAGARDRTDRHRQRLVASCAAPLNPDLARRVYDQEEGTIDLIPGPGLVCCVAIAGATGELMAGTTSLELAARGSHGFNSTAHREGTSTFRGALSQSVSGVRIVDASGRTIVVPINADDAYWITVADAVDLIETMTDGTERRIPFHPPGADYPPQAPRRTRPGCGRPPAVGTL